MKIKASKQARITPLKGFKDAVMSASAAPKLAKGVWPPAEKAAGAKVAAAAKVAPAKANSLAGAPKAAASRTVPRRLQRVSPRPRPQPSLPRSERQPGLHQGRVQPPGGGRSDLDADAVEWPPRHRGTGEGGDLAGKLQRHADLPFDEPQ